VTKIENQSMTCRRGSFVVLVAAFAFVIAAVAPARASNDPDYKTRQYGVKQINAPSAWAKTKGDGVIIAIVDSGIDREHPDLKDKLLPGYDFADEDDNSDDDGPDAGHGTHVAGIAGAITDNGVGIAGVAPNAKLLPAKVFESGSGSFLPNTVDRAIRYATDQGARVINLSLSEFILGAKSELIGLPCRDAMQRGAICVVSSGNEGEGLASGYSRDFPGLIVTANDKEGRHASFAQKADTKWSISAPGVNIWSTWPVEKESYSAQQGTSMAAPHAAGVVALTIASMNAPPTLAGAQAVLDRVVTTARPMGDSATNGAGRIDAAGAVGAPVVEETESGPSSPTTSPIPQTYNERLRQQHSNAPTGTAAPTAGAGDAGGAPPAAGEPAPAAAAGETTDPTAPDTQGIRLASGPVEGDDAGATTDGTKAMLIAIGAIGVLGTAGWSGSFAARRMSSRKLKAF
jgi:subtilisin family serine protease